MTARKAASNFDMAGLKVINLGTPDAASNDAVRKVDLETVQAYATSRANHTGSQLAATISDFDIQVHLSRLDQLTAPTGSVGLGNQKLVNVQDPVAPQDGATRNYVDSQLAGLASGQTLKGTVRAASTVNVDVTSAPASIGGVSAAAGDVFLLTGQTTGSQNGPWVWAATSTAMTRATNWDSAAEAVIGSYWIVREGTQADKFALMTNDTFTYNSSTAGFAFIGVAPVLPTVVELTVGDGAATSFAVTHNLNTRAVNVMVYRVASPYDEVDVRVEHTDLNTITLKPDAVWAAGEFRAAVSKM
ncbi:MAG: hypothetical protein ABWY93_18560 [Mycobacterium sp.]